MRNIKLSIYLRWFRIKRVKARRYVRVALPAFFRAGEQAAGDNFPVLCHTFSGEGA